MNAWWLLSVIPLLMLTVTAAARLADMGRDQWTWRHHARRVGLILVGFLSFVSLVAPLTLGWWKLFPEEVATWRSCALAWGWAMVWLTTPNMVPWYDYILGVHRDPALWSTLTTRERAVAEYRALRNSFRPYRLRVPLDPAEPATPK